MLASGYYGGITDIYDHEVMSAFCQILNLPVAERAYCPTLDVQDPTLEVLLNDVGMAFTCHAESVVDSLPYSARCRGARTEILHA